jgi:MFS family permease
MQIVIEMTTAANIATALFSAVLSVYLFALWRRQENPLLTDLPLMFGITFLTQAVNNMILVLPSLGIVEASMELFRFRAIVIIGSAFPLLVVLLTIWLPRFSRHHSKIIGVLAVYWLLVALLAPTDQTIMMMHLPVIAALTIGIIITFSITWRTGRLKEVRSDLLVISFLLGLVGQAAKVPLMNMGLDVLGHLINAVATVLITLALANPWYNRGAVTVREQPNQQVAHVTG